MKVRCAKCGKLTASPRGLKLHNFHMHEADDIVANLLKDQMTRKPKEPIMGNTLATLEISVSAFQTDGRWSTEVSGDVDGLCVYLREEIASAIARVVEATDAGDIEAMVNVVEVDAPLVPRRARKGKL